MDPNLDALANLDAQHHVDCTLACDGGQIEVHKMVLSVCSTYLQKIIATHPVEHPIIILPSIKVSDLRILVNYMYTGELLKYPEEPSEALLEAAKFLGVNSIKDYLSKQATQLQLPQTPPPQSALMQNDTNNFHSYEDDILDGEDEAGDNNPLTLHHHINTLNNVLNNEYQPFGINLNSVAALKQHLNNNNIGEDYSVELSASEAGSDRFDPNDGDDFISATPATATAIATNGHDMSELNSNPDTLGLSTIVGGPEAVDETGRIRCQLCDIRLSDVKCLYRHVLTRHLRDRWSYRCEFCDREFSRDDHLMRHYTTKHKGMEFDREKIRETRRHNREMAKTFHDQFSADQMSSLSALL